MKSLFASIFICSTGILIYSCNKSVTNGVALEFSEKNKFQHSEDQVLSLHKMSGCYTGKICNNDSENYENMRVVLLENSTFDLFCETLGGNKKQERIKGAYSFNQDTLTLYTALHNQKYLIKNSELHYIGDTLSTVELNSQIPYILYKN